MELPKDRRFEAEALAKDGRNRQVDGVLEAMLGGGLEIQGGGRRPHRSRRPDPPPAEAAPAAPDQVIEFEVDPANDEGRPIDADADARGSGGLGRQGARREGHRGASERLVRQGRRPGREEGTVAMGMPRGGGFNPNQMLKQLQKMQREMEDTQAQLAERGSRAPPAAGS